MAARLRTNTAAYAIALVAAWCLASITAAAEPQSAAGALTVDQAVAVGLAQNRSLKNAETDVARAEDEIAALRTRRRPAFQVNILESRLLGELNLYFPGGAFGVFPTTGPIPAEDTTVTSPARWTTFVFARVTQPLSQLHRIGLGLKQLELGRDIAAERVKARRQAVVNDVRRLYYGIQQTESGMVARERSLELHREVDRLVGQFVAEGAALASDALEVKALVAKEQHETTLLRNSVATLREQLNVLLGRDLDEAFTTVPVPDVPMAAEDVKGLETSALATRPEIRQVALALDQARYDVRLKRDELRPEVSATFNYLGFYRFEVLPPAIATAGVQVSWEPFDWGRKRRELAAKVKVVEQAATHARDVEAGIRVEVRTAARKMAETRAAIDVAVLGLEAAREKVRVATERYREQQSLMRELLQAQAALAAADQQHHQARLAFATARADFERAVGDR